MNPRSKRFHFRPGAERRAPVTPGPRRAFHPSTTFAGLLSAAAAAGFLIAFAPGCVSQSADRGDVIERSAELKPAWAAGDFSSEGTAEMFVLFRREGLTRLELGIKQTQASGIEQGCKLLQERMKGEIEARASEASVSSEALSNAASAALAKLESDGRCPDISPKFVYWELLRKDTAEGSRQAYDVYVLLATKKRQYTDALSAAVDTIRTSGAPGADALAAKVSESYEP